MVGGMAADSARGGMRSDGVGMVARATLLLLVGGGAGVALNAMRGAGGLALRGFEAPVMCDATEAQGEPPEIEPAAAAALCGRPDVVIADTRPAGRYAEGHIAGAVHLPCDAGGRVAADAFARFEGERTIIVYGQTTDEAVPVAASLRRRYHAADVRVLRGGFAGWEGAGLACASGPCDDCREHGR